MFRGRVRFSVPMIYSIGFIYLFVVGGITGILLANPTIDYQVHNTVFLVAHFHNVAIPGVLFGLLAGYHFWFPKAFGFRLDETLGKISAFCWIFGFMLAFFPLYALGLMGLPRRSVAYDQPSYVPLEIVALAGAILVTVALVTLVVQLWVSIKHRAANRVSAGDPWDGRSLEWSVAAPPPPYNFAVIPVVTGRDAFTIAKQAGEAYQTPDHYDDIELPKNSVMGPVLGAISFALAFGLVWHIWWMVVLFLVAALATVIIRGFARDTTLIIPAGQVQEDHGRWLDSVAAANAISREDERKSANRGLAKQALPGVPA
jgi:cytochrome o ubiquinol oxidase subunit 1